MAKYRIVRRSKLGIRGQEEETAFFVEKKCSFLFFSNFWKCGYRTVLYRHQSFFVNSCKLNHNKTTSGSAKAFEISFFNSVFKCPTNNCTLCANPWYVFIQCFYTTNVSYIVVVVFSYSLKIGIGNSDFKFRFVFCSILNLK